MRERDRENLKMIEYQRKPKYMTVAMVAEYIQLSKATIYLLVSQNRIPHLKVLGKNRFERGQIDDWMMSQQVRSQLPQLPKF
jgi:excisionase family DNA binding protein